MLLGIDLGTTGTMCLAFDADLHLCAEVYRPITSTCPQPGWVEQDPEAVVQTMIETVGDALHQIGGVGSVQAVGLDNQGESLLAWDAKTGKGRTRWRRALGPAQSGGLGVLAHPDWGGELPWRASLVDQPAALAGNGCFQPGECKITYGTGCFLLANGGTTPPAPGAGLLASIGWDQGQNRVYVLDGGVFTAGTAIDWLVNLGLASSPQETAVLAELAGENGVRFLPAFTGLGAPWWDGDARGVFSGLTAGTTRAHLVRAVLDSIAFRVCDVAEALWVSGISRPDVLRVDGGLTANRYLMQRQADLLGIPLECSTQKEATATGIALLVALSLGTISETEARTLSRSKTRFEPNLPEPRREAEYTDWKDWLQIARRLP